MTSTITNKIAIVMCTYNGEEFISEQLDSILSQTYQNFTLYIYDDISSDKTLEIIKRYAKYDDRIKWFQNNKNLGYIKNFEQAIMQTSENYIALADQDDIWVKEKLEIQFLKLFNYEKENPDSAILVHSDLIMIDEEERRIKPSYFSFRNYKLMESKDIGHILGPCGIMGNTVLFNKALKKKILPFPDMIDQHDYWIALVNELFGTRLTIYDPLVHYRIHSSNASNNATVLGKKKIRFLSHYIQGNVKLPYIDSNRYELLKYILEQYPVHDQNDRKCIEKFMSYLKQEGSKIDMIISFFTCSYLKRSLGYRLKTIIKLLVYRT